MFTDWNDTAEFFDCLGHVWDVRAAKRLLREKPREVEVVYLRDVAPFLTEGPGIIVDRDLVESGEGIDLDVPIIVGELNTSCLPIDGWHRIARALKLGLDTLPCVCLTKEETEDVRC